MTGQHAAIGRTALARRRARAFLASPAGPMWEVIVWVHVAVALGWARAPLHAFIAYGLGTGFALFLARVFYGWAHDQILTRRWRIVAPESDWEVVELDPEVQDTITMWLDNRLATFTPDAPPEGNDPK